LKATLDVQNRITLPTKLRGIFGSNFRITKGIDEPCVTIYTDESWAELVERMKALSYTKRNRFQRFLEKEEIETDKQGRFVIPSRFREYADLNSELEIVWMEGYAEIWNKDNWDKNEVSREEALLIADEL